MRTPRLEINLDKIEHNARVLVERLKLLGISVTGVTKAVLGSPEIAHSMIRGGVIALGDSRVENIETMGKNKVSAPMILIRTPMLSQVDRIVSFTDVSFNSEIEVIRRISASAKNMNKMHNIILMVELGDLREGIMPGDIDNIVHQVIQLPNINLKGIGANLACRNGVSPDEINMSELSDIVSKIENKFEIHLETISGGNSANLNWAFGCSNVGRINNLRLGESILLGLEPLCNQPIHELYTDAFELVTEIIESKTKPSVPWGKMALTAFDKIDVLTGKKYISQSILPIGHQDIDPNGLTSPVGVSIIGASSDHLIVESIDGKLSVGDEIRFKVNYSALLRAMTSPFIKKEIL